ncbi:hypothetical protein ACFX11_016218 [Malus domestica]
MLARFHSEKKTAYCCICMYVGTYVVVGLLNLIEPRQYLSALSSSHVGCLRLLPCLLDVDRSENKKQWLFIGPN